MPQEGGKATQPKQAWESGAKSMPQLNDPGIAKITDVVNCVRMFRDCCVRTESTIFSFISSEIGCQSNRILDDDVRVPSALRKSTR